LDLHVPFDVSAAIYRYEFVFAAGQGVHDLEAGLMSDFFRGWHVPIWLRVPSVGMGERVEVSSSGGGENERIDAMAWSVECR
jgi:hypothetical protein